MMNCAPPNAKWTNSKLWYFLTRINKGYYEIRTQPITESEIRKGIRQKQHDRAISTDNRSPGIFNVCYKLDTRNIKQTRDIRKLFDYHIGN